MLSDEKLQLIRRLAVQARNTDTGDESVNFALNAIMDGFDTLLDGITRLRAENEQLRAEIRVAKSLGMFAEIFGEASVVEMMRTAFKEQPAEIEKLRAERDEARGEAVAHNAAATQYEADIASLRAEVAAAEDRAEKAERERDEWCRQCNLASEAQADALNDASVARRERDEARANYAFMVERAADQRLDGYRELGAKAAAAEERAEKAERERDEARAEVATLLANADADAHTISRMGRGLAAARAERDARPAITPDDCAIRDEYIRAPDDKIRPYMTGAVARIDVALSAHGKKARIYPCEKCGKMRSEDEGGAEFRYCDTCRVVAKAAKP